MIVFAVTVYAKNDADYRQNCNVFALAAVHKTLKRRGATVSSADVAIAKKMLVSQTNRQKTGYQ